MNKLAYQFGGILVKLPIGNRWHPQMGTSEGFNESAIYKAVASIQGNQQGMLQYQQQTLPPLDLTIQVEATMTGILKKDSTYVRIHHMGVVTFRREMWLLLSHSPGREGARGLNTCNLSSFCPLSSPPGASQ